MTVFGLLPDTAGDGDCARYSRMPAPSSPGFASSTFGLYSPCFAPSDLLRSNGVRGGDGRTILAALSTWKDGRSPSSSSPSWVVTKFVVMDAATALGPDEVSSLTDADLGT
jgi:hypothetical protein